jgi:hypothetical protein
VNYRFVIPQVISERRDWRFEVHITPTGPLARPSLAEVAEAVYDSAFEAILDSLSPHLAIGESCTFDPLEQFVAAETDGPL